MSAQDQLHEKDHKLTRSDWFGKTKQALRLRSADNGLQSNGNKSDLINRLFNFLHSTSNQLEGPGGIGDASSSDNKRTPCGATQK